MGEPNTVGGFRTGKRIVLLATSMKLLPLLPAAEPTPVDSELRGILRFLFCYQTIAHTTNHKTLASFHQAFVVVNPSTPLVGSMELDPQ